MAMHEPKTQMKTLDEHRREAYASSFKQLFAMVRSPRALFYTARNPRQTIKNIKRLSAPFFDVRLKESSAESQIALYRNSLLQLSELAAGDRKCLSVEEFLSHPAIQPWVNTNNRSNLKLLLDKHGSDKASTHSYHLLYQPILLKVDTTFGGENIRLMEIGLGTNNIDVKCNMGVYGRPGASARAFRDFLPGAQIDGADIDRRILFNEERIRTFWVDQLSKQSLTDLFKGQAYHLVIDDGLHTFEANLNTVVAAMDAVVPGGWIAVEDIPNIPEASQIWLAMSNLVADQFETFVVDTTDALVFLAQKK
jgi:hypothetical protein